MDRTAMKASWPSRNDPRKEDRTAGDMAQEQVGCGPPAPHRPGTIPWRSVQCLLFSTSYVSSETRTDICRDHAGERQGAASALALTRPGTAKAQIRPSARCAPDDTEARTGNVCVTLTSEGIGQTQKKTAAIALQVPQSRDVEMENQPADQ
ncbi:hypothetical protein LTR49_022147 [Elasticomyces elasticus]|nr:hypothetical protein LTR49_022147 [Elasticomyces elasticus]